MAHHMIAAVASAESAVPAQAGTRRPYDPPAVVYEAVLKVRAGSVIDGPTGLDC